MKFNVVLPLHYINVICLMQLFVNKFQKYNRGNDFADPTGGGSNGYGNWTLVPGNHIRHPLDRDNSSTTTEETVATTDVAIHATTFEYIVEATDLIRLLDLIRDDESAGSYRI